MRLRAEQPHFRAHCKDGTVWLLDLNGLAGFEDAWMNGPGFWVGVDAYGARVRIKLGDIIGVSVWDEARLAVLVDENEEIRQRELTSGKE